MHCLFLAYGHGNGGLSFTSNYKFISFGSKFFILCHSHFCCLGEKGAGPLCVLPGLDPHGVRNSQILQLAQSPLGHSFRPYRDSRQATPMRPNVCIEPGQRDHLGQAQPQHAFAPTDMPGGQYQILCRAQNKPGTDQQLLPCWGNRRRVP